MVLEVSVFHLEPMAILDTKDDNEYTRSRQESR
jgi:hypothetical protein